MHPRKHYLNLKKDATSNVMQKDFFRWLKETKLKELLSMQRIQLFVDSKSANNEPIGTYNYTHPKQSHKEIGKPFTLKDTGELFKKMRVTINISKKVIFFQNRRKGISDDSHRSFSGNFRYDTAVYDDGEWFGLTDENTKILMVWAQEFAVAWTLNKFRYGKSNFKRD